MILFTADIHIKIGQKNVPRDWARNRYKILFEQLNNTEATSMIIPGDIFDRVPTLEELQVYWDFVSNIKVPTILSTGNHESTKKGASFFSFLKESTERLNPLVEVVVDYIKTTDQYHVVPYEYIKSKSTWDELSKLPVFTHVRGEILPHVKPEINLDWLSKFPVVFAGDLHSHSNTQRNIVYPGSPVTTSFHRKETDTGYILIKDDFSWEWEKLQVPQLLRKTVSSVEEMIEDPYHRVIYELTGDMGELANAENHELLDKKVVVKSTDVTLKLEDMSIEEELYKYLVEVEKIKDVDSIMGVHNEYNKIQNS